VTLSTVLLDFGAHQIGIGLATGRRMFEIHFSSSVPARSVFVEEAAARLNVSRRTVYYRIQQGRLRTIRTRCGSQRVLLDSIDELLSEEKAKRAR
jgi:excisionase family DNA binding protein